MRIHWEIRPQDIQLAMDWLARCVGSPLDKRGAYLNARVRQNPFLSLFVRRQFATELALWQARKRHRVGKYPKGSEYDPAYGFAVTAYRVWNRLSAPAQARLVGSLKGGLKNDFGLIPLSCELQILVHLCRQGFDVQCVDLEKSEPKHFDFLATRNGVTLEIECKTASPDVGNRIPLAALCSLGGYLHLNLRGLLSRGGGRLLKIALPGRLEMSQPTMEAITSLLAAAVSTAGGRAETEFASIEYKQVTASIQAGFIDESFLRSQFLEHFALTSGQILFHGRRSNFAAVAVRSYVDNDPIGAVLRQAKDAADQCSGQRPAIVAIQLVDLGGEQLKALVAQKSGVYSVADGLFQCGRRSHVNVLAFLTQPVTYRHPITPWLGNSSGVVGLIQNPEPRFPCPDARNLFAIRQPAPLASGQ